MKTDAFAADTAKKTGKSERAIQRDAARANLIEVLPDVVGTSLDKGSELDALAKLPVEQQRALAKRAKAEEKVSAKATRRRRAPKSFINIKFHVSPFANVGRGKPLAGLAVVVPKNHGRLRT